MEGDLLSSFTLIRLLLFLRKLGWKYLREGIYFNKLLEYPLALDELELKSGHRVLDIGPGKSFLPFYLISKGLEVWLVDTGEFYPDFEQFYLGISKDKFPHQKGLLKIMKGDFLKLEFPLNYYDRIYAISTLEHFEHQDDIKAVIKLNHLLKPNGIFVCSLPFSQSGTKERLIEQSGFKYFQRDYELECIYRRIIDPSGLKLKHFIVIGEKIPRLNRMLYFKNPFCKAKLIWTIFLTDFLWKIYYKGKGRNLNQFKYPGVIIVVLKK